MLRLFAIACTMGLVFWACSQTEEPTPTPATTIDPEAVDGTVLTTTDVGPAWEISEEPIHSTVQIGGRIGPANVSDAKADAVSSFIEKDGTGFVTNSVFLMPSVETARAVIAAHTQSAASTQWSQQRQDGGSAEFEVAGTIDGLDGLGEQMYATRLDVEITGPDETLTERTVEYVVYRLGPVLGFVAAQDTDVGAFARAQAAKVTNLVAP